MRRLITYFEYRTARVTLIAAALVGLQLAIAVQAVASSRIKDIADFEGIRENQLIGYGLVVGLNGTGDSLNNTPFTQQSLQAMLDFIDNSSVCRNRFLLKYFGEEQKENCGKCDICMKKRSTEPSNAVEEILNLLKKESLSSRKLVMLLGFEEKQVLAALKQLLEEEKIQINLKNEYSLK